MKFIYPSLRWPQLRAVLAVALSGFAVGGVFGMAHDAITFSLGPDYFMLFKFAQFGWADLGWPPFAFAMQIGAIAGGAAGFIAGWFIGRMTVPWVEIGKLFPTCARAFGMVLIAAVLGSGSGFMVGRLRIPGSGPWHDDALSLGSNAPAAFSLVADIHLGSYLGALCGLLTALFLLRVKRSQSPFPRPSQPV